MVNEITNWLIIHTNLDPFKISNLTQTPERTCWEHLSDVNIYLTKIQENYYDQADERRLELQKFIEEIPEAREVKRQLLLERLHEAKRNSQKYNVKQLLAQAEAFTQKDETQVTQHEIIIAKQKPIAEILNVQRRGNISCPFHQDKNPSFQIKKNNTFACYSCGEYGDAIDLYIKINNVDFKTAVKLLQ